MLPQVSSGSTVVAIKTGRIQPSTVRQLRHAQVVMPADSSLQVSSSIKPRTSSEMVSGVGPDLTGTFGSGVTSGLPQVDGRHSVLLEDAIPNLQAALVTCAQLMISLSIGNELLNGRNVIRLEHSICQVLQCIRIQRNHAISIGKLPQEVLVAIFDFAATPSGTIDSISAFKNLMSLLQVCSYWRTILLDYSKAWSNVHLKGQDMEFLAWQMSLSRNAPLDVTVHFHDYIFNTGHLAHRYFRESAEAIRESGRRVRSVSVRTARSDHFQDFFGFELPNLEELAWENTGFGRPTHLLDAQVWDPNLYPKLRCLLIKGNLAWPMQSITGLTRFRLEGPMIVTVTAICNFLRRNETLESIELVNLGVPLPVREETKCVELHNLTSLSFHDVAHGHLFPFIHIPVLMDLSIRPLEHQSRWSPNVWCSLSLPVGITSLEVEYLGCEGSLDRVRITGYNDTQTHSLYLVEHSPSERLDPMLSALAQTPLHSITSISFDEKSTNDPRYQLSCASLRMVFKNLPNLRRADLCWGHFTHGIVGQLGFDCPELEILRVKTTRLTCPATFGLVLQMAKSRAELGMRLSRIECVVAEGRDAGETREAWDTLARNAGLERYLCDESSEATRIGH